MKWGFMDYLIAYILTLVAIVITVLVLLATHGAYVKATSEPEKRECVE